MYTAPGDYVAISSLPVTFSSTPSVLCTPISVLNDVVVENTESFTVSLVSEDAAVQLTQPLANVVINDSSSKCYTGCYSPVPEKGYSLKPLQLQHVVVDC